MSKLVQKPPRPEPIDELATLRRRLEEETARVKDLEDWKAAYEASEQESMQQLQEALGFSKPEEKRKWRWVLDAVEELKIKASAVQNQHIPPHVVRSFERGARAERARVLEQGRIELLSWPNGTPERRALEALRKALQDERLPLPAYKPPEGA